MHIFLAFIVRWQNVFHPDAAILVDCLFMFGHKILSCLFMMSVYCYQLKCFQHCFDVPFTCYVSISEPLVTSWTDCEGWSKYIDLTLKWESASWPWRRNSPATPIRNQHPNLSATSLTLHRWACAGRVEQGHAVNTVQHETVQCNFTALWRNPSLLASPLSRVLSGSSCFERDSAEQASFVSSSLLLLLLLVVVVVVVVVVMLYLFISFYHDISLWMSGSILVVL